MAAIARPCLRQLKLNGTHFICYKQFVCAVSTIKYNYPGIPPSSPGLQSTCRPRPINLLKNDCMPRPRLYIMQDLRYLQIREKHTKKKKGYVNSSDDEEEEQMEWKQDQSLSGKDSRIVRLVSNSLRSDLLVKAGLGVARNKVETLFYESKIRVNGEKISKKSSKLKVGDEIDIIHGPSPSNDDFILVSRIEIMSSIAREDGALNVHLRIFKSLTIENYATE